MDKELDVFRNPKVINLEQENEELKAKIELLEIAYLELGKSSTSYDNGCNIIRKILGREG